MNQQEYIESGVLQDYCLGVLSVAEKAAVEEMCRLYPGIKKELELLQMALEKLATDNARKPVNNLKATTWNILQNLHKEGDMSLKNLPVISKYSDRKKWMDMLRPLLPETLQQDEVRVPLQNTGKVYQRLFMSKLAYSDEVHETVREGIFILEGSCTCVIGGKEYKFATGDLIEIPLHVVHSLTITSPHMIFVVQHLAA